MKGYREGKEYILALGMLVTTYKITGAKPTDFKSQGSFWTTAKFTRVKYYLMLWVEYVAIKHVFAEETSFQNLESSLCSKR